MQAKGTAKIGDMAAIIMPHCVGERVIVGPAYMVESDYVAIRTMHVKRDETQILRPKEKVYSISFLIRHYQSCQNGSGASNGTDKEKLAKNQKLKGIIRALIEDKIPQDIQEDIMEEIKGVEPLFRRQDIAEALL